MTARRDAWLAGALAVGAPTALGALGRSALTDADIVLLYLTGVAVGAPRLPRAGAVATALIAVIAFNFCFVPPTFTLNVQDGQYLVTFVVLAGAGVAVSEVASRLRANAARETARADRAAQLFALSRRLTAAHTEDAIVSAANDALTALTGDPAALRLGDAPPPPGALPVDGLVRRLGTITLARPPSAPEDLALARVMATLVGTALDRARHSAEARAAKERAAAEQLRADLLAAVSHDLRTPLATVIGASSALLARGDELPADDRRALLTDIAADAERLSQRLTNLLEMTRLQGGQSPRGEWCPVEELVSSALRAAAIPAGGARVHLPERITLVWADPLLFESALRNVFENAARHAPAAPFEVEVSERDGAVHFTVSDRGPGFRSYDPATPLRSGGLGLAIAKAVLQTHGGALKIGARDGGGATVTLTLPIGGPDGAERPPELSQTEEPR